jgi:two-component system phosphate regulon sensor histidine kinase PhoR
VLLALFSSWLESRVVGADVEGTASLIWSLIAALLLISMIVFSILLSRIVASLHALQEGAERLSAGNFQQDVSLETGDDREETADAFNLMSRQLEMELKRLKQQKDDVFSEGERLRTVLGAMIEGVVAVDNRQQILFANRAAFTIFDLPNREVENRPLVEVIRHPGVHQLVEEVLHRRRLLTIEIELPRKQLVLSVIASRLPGEPAGGVVMVFHDMTELRRLENLRREFVSNVSHELKTPLASIQAYTDTLLEGALEDPANNRKFLERIEEQAGRLHMLILDVIKIAQVETGREVFEMSAIDIAEMVDECVQDHTALAESKRIQIEIEPPEGDARLHVRADAEGFRTILDNLLDNAIKYTLEDGTVTVSWHENEDRVYLKVADTGVGIPQEHLERIFERFYRVDKARSREMGGTGLGLSIVKHLTQVFGGGIKVESRQGEGSTFTVELPRT